MSKPVPMPRRIPPHMNVRRVAEMRVAATEGLWFTNCPEGRCREREECCGGLRRFHPGGPRCYPTCLKLVLEAILAGPERSPEQADAYQDILAHDEGFWATLEGRDGGQESGTALQLLFLDVLALPPGEEAGRAGAAGRPGGA